MRVSSWNIRGFNDPIKQQEVMGYLRENKVEVLELQHNASNKTFHVSFVYGSNDADHRERLWVELKGVASKVTNWILMGDWNIVRSMEERIGPNPPSVRDMLAFNQCILDCQLDDLHSLGFEYTWTNKQDAATRVWSRLDRVLSNPLWLIHFPTTQVHVLPAGVSDHSPLLVTVTDVNTPRKRFSYLNCWEAHEEYGTRVREAWDMPVRGNAMYSLFSKLKQVRQKLIVLHKHSYSGISEKVKEAQQHLHDYQSCLQGNPLDMT
ncbi:uncharacterized protein LOC141588104 [Silene latifolia]|uniref:uncharacterized protein LOC141588104 n=1 Tax=Silene latifolia TaxID=37657 RepID=UPI003D76ADCD